jgi:hypothetical protein
MMRRCAEPRRGGVGAISGTVGGLLRYFGASPLNPRNAVKILCVERSAGPKRILSREREADLSYFAPAIDD